MFLGSGKLKKQNCQAILITKLPDLQVTLGKFKNDQFLKLSCLRLAMASVNILT